MADQLELPEPSESSEPTGPTNGHPEAALAAVARHALHDEELVAAFAAGALEADEAEDVGRAQALVERCALCRGLHADLLAIGSAHRATAGLVVAAPRGFLLTLEDAERLRPGVPVVRRPAERVAAEPVAAEPVVRPTFLDRLRAAFRSVARPLGGTLVAAGLVGILVGSASFAAMPAGAPLPLSFDRQEAAAPGASAAQGGDNGSIDGSDDLRAASMTVDLRVVVLGASAGVTLMGLVLLARSRRRARESA